ncbi:MAG: TadE/TadG family type IV pilus assembly protein [Aliishimia sp.]
MIRKLTSALGRFRREENGQMVVEFALVIPLIFTIFMTSVELGLYSMRQMFLDRGLDMAVRQVRLNTSSQFSHTQVKAMICKFAGFIENCDSQLKLEMTPVDLRNFAGLNTTIDCTDASQPVAPVSSFIPGGEHEMMLLRACYKFHPVFATSGLGYQMSQNGDGAGMAKMISMAAFVQEPQ